MSRFNVEEAGAKRKCHKCGEVIKAGERCLTFSKGAGRYCVTGNLCKECIRESLDLIEGNVLTGVCRKCGKRLCSGDDGHYCSNKKCTAYDIDILKYDI